MSVSFFYRSSGLPNNQYPPSMHSAQGRRISVTSVSLSIVSHILISHISYIAKMEFENMNQYYIITLEIWIEYYYQLKWIVPMKYLLAVSVLPHIRGITTHSSDTRHCLSICRKAIRQYPVGALTGSWQLRDLHAGGTDQ